jgi:coenzyme PQQ precursor peptide PqqA
MSVVLLGSALAWSSRQMTCQITWENEMTWKTPKIVEVPVGMEINMYACAARK